MRRRKTYLALTLAGLALTSIVVVWLSASVPRTDGAGSVVRMLILEPRPHELAVRVLIVLLAGMVSSTSLANQADERSRRLANGALIISAIGLASCAIDIAVIEHSYFQATRGYAGDASWARAEFMYVNYAAALVAPALGFFVGSALLCLAIRRRENGPALP